MPRSDSPLPAVWAALLHNPGTPLSAAAAVLLLAANASPPVVEAALAALASSDGAQGVCDASALLWLHTVPGEPPGTVHVLSLAPLPLPLRNLSLLLAEAGGVALRWRAAETELELAPGTSILRFQRPAGAEAAPLLLLGLAAHTPGGCELRVHLRRWTPRPGARSPPPLAAACEVAAPSAGGPCPPPSPLFPQTPPPPPPMQRAESLPMLMQRAESGALSLLLLAPLGSLLLHPSCSALPAPPQWLGVRVRLAGAALSGAVLELAASAAASAPSEPRLHLPATQSALLRLRLCSAGGGAGDAEDDKWAVAPMVDAAIPLPPLRPDQELTAWLRCTAVAGDGVNGGGALGLTATVRRPGPSSGSSSPARGHLALSSLLAIDALPLLHCRQEGPPARLADGRCALQLLLRLPWPDASHRPGSILLKQLRLLPADEAAERCGAPGCACAAGADAADGTLCLPRPLSAVAAAPPLSLLFLLPPCAAAARVRLRVAAGWCGAACDAARGGGADRLPPAAASEAAAAAAWPLPPASAAAEEAVWEWQLRLPARLLARARASAPASARCGERVRIRYDLAAAEDGLPLPACEWRLQAACTVWLLLGSPSGQLAAGSGGLTADALPLLPGEQTVPKLMLRARADEGWCDVAPACLVRVLPALRTAEGE